MNKRTRKTRWLVGTTLLAAALVVGYFFLGNLTGSKAALPEDNLVPVERSDLTLTVVATGSIVPATEVEIKSKAAGIVKRILVEEGDLVEEGRILVELDRELLEAQVRESRANLEAVSARLEEARAEYHSTLRMREKLQMDLGNLEDKVAFHRRQLERFQRLFEEQLIPHAQLDERERELEDARFQLAGLQSELLMQDARIEAAEKAVTRVQAELSQAQAALDRADENLRYATIRSPVTAMVLKRHVEVGDAVSSILQLGSQATLILTLGDMREVYFEGRVDETDIGNVFVGQPARVRVDAYRDQSFPGQIERIAPLGEEKDNVIGFEARVSLEDPEHKLRANLTANAEIIIEERKNVLVIPESTIIYGENRAAFVELYDPTAPEQKRRVSIELGAGDGTRTEVQSGLAEGDKVVKQNARGLI
ncbi:MAG TPA: efflux RND transporter periplasmic adaptor subunit [Acidobacteriota bacterium]|jgi:HlyD family secretion protein|nr:efflux RND transporter periplasmic adaptor subunit [Acidobacteriota bacterium]HRV07645.1 efflux RND transporter periplasmic adaptor subunit [Acidobacteriota bacterium]